MLRLVHSSVDGAQIPWIQYNFAQFKRLMSETATGGVLQKNLLLKILQYSQENPCVSF